jgi:hypothetical protein
MFFLLVLLRVFVRNQWLSALPFVAVFVANLLLNVPATRNLSAWYVGETILVVAIPLAIAAWAFYTSIAGRLWTADLFAEPLDTSDRPN